MTQMHPFFSVIIPTRDRPEQLFNCLQSLQRQTYPPDRFEVIVVDDGGKMPLEAVVDCFSDRIDVRLLKDTHIGPAKARNTGAACAKGLILAFTDDDCVPANDWLENFALVFSRSADCLVGGSTINALTRNPYSCASQLINEFIHRYHDKNYDKPVFSASNNFAVPTDRFRALGGFDVSFPFAGGEDREFCDRWLNQGHSIVYVPKIQIYHAHHLTFISFLRQQFNYGRGSFLFHKLAAKRNRNSIRLQPMAFYLELLCFPFLTTRGFRMTMLTILISLSQLAVGLGFVSELIGNYANFKSKWNS